MSERLEELKRFTLLMPDDPFPLYGLALEHRSEGNFPEAAATFEQLMSASRLKSQGLQHRSIGFPRNSLFDNMLYNNYLL